MNRITIKLGFWSALICAVTFVIWIICFVSIAITSPLFTWTNIADYQQYISTNNQFFQYLAKAFMLLFAISFLILIHALQESVSEQFRTVARLGVAFGILFSVVTSMHYFVQISAVRFSITSNEFAGLEHFLQAKPTSVISSVNMLGWTLFLGLSSLFFFGALRNGVSGKLLRIAFLIMGLSCLLGGFGFLTQIDLITFVCINLGMGGGVLVMTVAASGFFLNLSKSKE